MKIEKELLELKRLEGGIEEARERFATRKAEGERGERVKQERETLERREQEAKWRRETEAAKNGPSPRPGMER